MAIADSIPGLDDKELANLHDNAVRLSASEDARKQEAAAGLIPLIEAELERRLALAPPKKTAKPRAKKAAVVVGAYEDEDEGADA